MIHHPFYPPVRLIRVNTAYWSSKPSSEGITLAQLWDATAQGARKMAKGVSIRDQRTHLLLASRRLAAWVEDAIPLNLPWWEAPAALRSGWSAVLAALARQRASVAAARLSKQSVLPFLPALFPYADDDRIEAGAYGKFDVTSHITELQAWLRNPGVSSEEPSLRTAAEHRLEQFTLAGNNGEGIVEFIWFHRSAQ